MTKKSTVHIYLSEEKREYLEKSAELGGFQSLTDFFITAASEKAEAIQEKRNAWLSSENDRRIFFNAIVNPSPPNVRLRGAMKRHSEFNSKKY